MICFLLLSVRVVCFVLLALNPFNMISLLIYRIYSLKLGGKLVVISFHGFNLSFLARKIFLSFYVIYVIFNLQPLFFSCYAMYWRSDFFLANKLTETKLSLFCSLCWYCEVVLCIRTQDLQENYWLASPCQKKAVRSISGWLGSFKMALSTLQMGV